MAENKYARMAHIAQQYQAAPSEAETRLGKVGRPPGKRSNPNFERLTVLVMGTNDLAKELQAEHAPDRQPLLAGLALCLLAARATGKVILDGVYNDIKDAEGFEAECRQGRQLGCRLRGAHSARRRQLD
jgi:citrate lyase beta subunit